MKTTDETKSNYLSDIKKTYLDLDLIINKKCFICCDSLIKNQAYTITICGNCNNNIFTDTLDYYRNSDSDSDSDSDYGEIISIPMYYSD